MKIYNLGFQKKKRRINEPPFDFDIVCIVDSHLRFVHRHLHFLFSHYQVEVVKISLDQILGYPYLFINENKSQVHKEKAEKYKSRVNAKVSLCLFLLLPNSFV